MPDDARVWVFASPQPVEGAEAEAILAAVDRFLAGWHAHGTPVVGARDWRYDRFLLVAADEAATGVSGCSIDSLFRTLKGLETELGVRMLDSAPVWYREAGGEIRAVTRGEFRARGAEGGVGASTPVFDNTVRTVGQVRNGEWETSAARSWHGRLIGV